MCVKDAPGGVPGEHGQGGSGGREGPGSGPEGGEDTWSCSGCSRDRAFQVTLAGFLNRLYFGFNVVVELIVIC